MFWGVYVYACLMGGKEEGARLFPVEPSVRTNSNRHKLASKDLGFFCSEAHHTGCLEKAAQRGCGPSTWEATHSCMRGKMPLEPHQPQPCLSGLAEAGCPSQV